MIKYCVLKCFAIEQTLCRSVPSPLTTRLGLKGVIHVLANMVLFFFLQLLSSIHFPVIDQDSFPPGPLERTWREFSLTATRFIEVFFPQLCMSWDLI